MSALLAQAYCDGDDRLIAADEPLAGLQLRCGGEVPGTIAVPTLLELVRKARNYRLKLARSIRANDGSDQISAWVEVDPADDGGCSIAVHSWQATPLPADDAVLAAAHRAAIDRTTAELNARLDACQRVLAVEASAPDLQPAAQAMRGGAGQPWTDFIEIDRGTHRQPLHWRLLDGAKVAVPGSARIWRVSLLPQEIPGREPAGFELCLVADVPLATTAGSGVAPATAAAAMHSELVGREIAPVLRQPIARIIANAELIHSRLAGPIPDEYSQYAADIAAAGQHLLSMVDDLADLEAVETDGFQTAPEQVDLAEVARRAAGILAGRAQERGITIDAPKHDEQLPAWADPRRVLQVLLNLVGNAIHYSPPNAQVWIRVEAEADPALDPDGARARVVVADQGPGLSKEQQQRVFDKFERLGRSDEHGSGLGLYISRRLARAMRGDLTVESAPGQGARFILDLPAVSAP